MGVSRVNSAAALNSTVSSVAERSSAVAKQSSRDKVDFSESAREASSEKSFSELIKEQTEKIDRLFSRENGTADDRQLNSIRMKLRSGLMLSANEEQYLSKYDPDGYSNYRTTLDARRMFRSQLACCRTKDDVNGMRLSNALSALSSYKKAMKNGGDGSAVAGLNMALEREISDYTKSARYRSLPTAAERDKYYMELAKARRFEREKRAAEKQNALSKGKKKKQVKQPGDGKRTVAQVENSSLGRKVRNAGKGGSCLSYSSSLMRKSYTKMDQKG